MRGDLTTMGNDNLRIGLFLHGMEIDRRSSLTLVALSLIREWSNLFPGQFVVFHRSSVEEFMPKVDGFGQFTRHGLRRLEDICAYRQEVDVLHTPYWWSEIAIEGLPQVHFIPDVTYIFYPHHEQKLFVDHFVLACRRAMGVSKFIITPSEYTKRTLVEQFGFPEERIRVVYHGVHRIFLDESNGGSRPHHLPQAADSYLFFPAVPVRRKNHKGLLDALVLLRQRYAFEPHCVFVGDLAPSPRTVDVKAEIVKRGLSKTVHCLGEVSLSELKYLYSNAKALIFPSLLEGFGIPVLEAMTVGCPVLASNRTSIPEVAGETAFYFDPQDPGDIADTIVRFFQDPGIAEKLVPEAKKRAKHFSDARQALETRAVLQEAYHASKADFRRLTAIVNESGKMSPTVTVILLFQRSTYREVMPGIEKLVKAVGYAVELIWIVSLRDAHLLAGMPVPGRSIRHEADFHATVMKAAQEACGTFVFFSNGEVVPLSSFVFFLMEKMHSVELTGDFVHGEVYFKDSPSEVIRSSVHFYTIREETEKDYCFHYLPFVVRREAVLGALARVESPLGSLSDLAELLFHTCKGKRLFLPVCAKMAGVRPRESPHSAVFLSRLGRELTGGQAIFRHLNHPVVRNLALRLFDEYVRLPQWVRTSIRFLAKPIWNQPRRE